MLSYWFIEFTTLCYADNDELYCKTGVPFVMGTTSGDRDLLYKTVEEAKLYAVISPQMGKHGHNLFIFLFKLDV